MSQSSKRFISFRYSDTKNGIPLWRIHKDKIYNPNEVVVVDDFRVVIDYPLRFPKLFIFNVESKDDDYSSSIDFDVISSFPHTNEFTRTEILNIISRTYKMIYKEEKNTSTLIINENSQIPRLVPAKGKRQESNGVYGLHSYHLTDLKISGMIYVPTYDYWKLFIKGE